MYVKKSIKNFIFIISLSLGIMTVMYCFSDPPRFWFYQYLTDNRSLVDGLLRLSCPNVVNRTVFGRWIVRNYTSQELEKVEDSIRRQRNFYKMPESLQRIDGKCGNLNYEGVDWQRALCNPKGPTPCCFNNTCVNKTVQECQCPECYDFRPQLLAELADWIPDDHTCKIQYFNTKEKVCEVLDNTTLYFVGNSYQRQLYVSLLGMLENNGSANIFNRNTPPHIIQKCDKYYRYIAECRFNIIHDLTECNNTVQLHCSELYMAADVQHTINIFQRIAGRKNSWFIFGYGLGDNYNADYVIARMFIPFLANATKYEWPKLVYHEPHTGGLLKSPREPGQQNPNRRAYNLKVNELMRRNNVTILSFSNMTANVVSYDGSHYGKGVNDVKAHILLNHILEQKMMLN